MKSFWWLNNGLVDKIAKQHIYKVLSLLLMSLGDFPWSNCCARVDDSFSGMLYLTALLKVSPLPSHEGVVFEADDLFQEINTSNMSGLFPRTETR